MDISLDSFTDAFEKDYVCRIQGHKLFIFMLATSADTQILSEIIGSFDEVHHLTGDEILVIAPSIRINEEKTTREQLVSVLDGRSEANEEIVRRFKRRQTEETYRFARSIGLAITELPSIVFFEDLGKPSHYVKWSISTDRSWKLITELRQVVEHLQQRCEWFLEPPTSNKSASCSPLDVLVDLDSKHFTKVPLIVDVKPSRSQQELVARLVSPLAYKIGDQAWYKPLPSIISKDTATLRKNTIDAFILTATPIELEAILRLMKPYSRQKAIWRVSINQETYYLGRFGRHSAVATMCEMGFSSRGGAILTTFEAIRTWNPQAVIMTGIAFGRDPDKQGIADVLVASQVICYELQRVGPKTIYRGPIVEPGPTLLNRFRHTLGWHFERPDGTTCHLQIGAILSGEKLIDNADFKMELFNTFPQAIGGDMEASGVYASANRQGIEWIAVKGICDWADGTKGDTHQPLAAASAASLAHAVLSAPNALPQRKSIEKHSSEKIIVSDTEAHRNEEEFKKPTDPANRNASKEKINWIGVTWDKYFLAYDGPLERLKLIEDRAFDDTFADALTSKGYKVRLGVSNRLSDHARRGYRIIYFTDQRTWRQRIVKNGKILLASLEAASSSSRVKTINMPNSSANSLTTSRSLRVFLCHSSDDKQAVRQLYNKLRKEKVDPWLDEENLLPGQDWKREIQKAVRNSDVVIVCLSQESVTRAGYVQKEIKYALDIADEQPEETIFVIPVKLEECNLPDRLSHLHYVNLFEKGGYEKLIRALRVRSERLEIGPAYPTFDSALDSFWNEEAIRAAEYVFDHLFEVHRGCILWCPDVSAVFGNDGYDPQPGENLDEGNLWVRNEVRAFRKKIEALGLKELGFGKTNDGYTWTILVSSGKAEMLNDLVWTCYPEGSSNNSIQIGIASVRIRSYWSSPHHKDCGGPIMKSRP